MSTKKKAKTLREARVPGPKKAGLRGVGAEEFVRIWQAAKTPEEARQKLGQYASNRAAIYRRKGVKLKKFAALGEKLDYAALNKLATGSVK